MIKTYALAATAALAAFTSVNAWAADPLPTESHKVLTAALALEAAETAVAACKQQGYNVTVTIVDRMGTPKLILVGDGARPLTLEVTRRKAYTSAMQRVSTGDFTKRVSTPGAFNPGMYDKELTTGQGGLPIKAGEDTIGGIAAAGAPGGDKDEACANAGLAKIGDQLK
ncbi:MAG TPA: heme-binding protein [Xanthobacteraceae bacterium]|nr:heme-binding protein [Xanthobacteraceae bacterium]